MYSKKCGQVFIINLAISAFLAVLINCSENPASKGDTNTDAENAMTFALKIVKTFFDKDTATFRNSLMDTIYVLEYWDAPIPACSVSVADLITGPDISNYTFDDYLNTYDPVIMSYSEYQAMGLTDSLVYWKPDENDYLFIGSQVKEGKTGFMWEDMLVFMVAKMPDNTWKFKAVSG